MDIGLTGGRYPGPLMAQHGGWAIAPYREFAIAHMGI